MLPWLVGVAPFGLVVGLRAADAGLSVAETSALAGFLFSGSAQLAATDAIQAGSSAAVAIGSVAIISARLIMYSSAISTNWRQTPLGFRALASAFLIDPTFAVGTDGYRAGRGHRYYAGSAAALVVSWFCAVLGGMSLGAFMPAYLGLEYAVALFLLAEAVDSADDRPARTAVLVGGAFGVLGTALPLHSGMLVAIIGGATAAVFVERSSR